MKVGEREKNGMPVPADPHQVQEGQYHTNESPTKTKGYQGSVIKTGGGVRQKKTHTEKNSK